MILLALVKPLGLHMVRIYAEQPNRFERMLYRIAGVNPDQEMNWKVYCNAAVQSGGAGGGVRTPTPTSDPTLEPVGASSSNT